MSADAFEAACAVLAAWRASPHAVIRLDLKRALEGLQAAIDADAAAQRLEGRRIDHDAWAAVFNGHDKPGV